MTWRTELRSLLDIIIGNFSLVFTGKVMLSIKIAGRRKPEFLCSVWNKVPLKGFSRIQQSMNIRPILNLIKRKRIIIIGWRKGTDHFYPEFEKIRSNATVHDLLDDLAPVERGQENNAYRLTYDQCSAYLKENNIRMEEDVVTHHIARPNNDRDVTIYGMAIDASVTIMFHMRSH